MKINGEVQNRIVVKHKDTRNKYAMAKKCEKL